MIINLSKAGFDFANANELNVPVNICVSMIDDFDASCRDELTEYASWWLAEACNYMPRKGHITHRAYVAVCQSRGELVAHIQKHTRPLYLYALNAIDNLDQADEDGCSCLEYWG